MSGSNEVIFVLLIRVRLLGILVALVDGVREGPVYLLLFRAPPVAALLSLALVMGLRVSVQPLVAQGFLDRVHLEGAALGGAHFIRADLRKTNLRGAFLMEADLRGARLAGTKLQNANLRSAKLSEATGLKEALCNGFTQFPKGYSCRRGKIFSDAEWEAEQKAAEAKRLAAEKAEQEAEEAEGSAAGTDNEAKQAAPAAK